MTAIRVTTALLAAFLCIGLAMAAENPEAAKACAIDWSTVGKSDLPHARKLSDAMAAKDSATAATEAIYLVRIVKMDVPYVWWAYATLTFEGSITPDDLAEAPKMMRRVAEAGCPAAQVAMVYLYAHSDKNRGLVQNIPEAYKWARLAANNGDPAGAALREKLAQQQPEDAAEGEKLAAAFKPTPW